MLDAPRLADWPPLDAYIEAFEARARVGLADVADFVPPPGHPQHREILRELACVDMELASKRGEPRRAADYAARFAELADDESRAALERQEARLRAGATRRVDGTASAPLGWREAAAAIYDAHRRGVAPAPTFLVGSAEHADVMIELQRRDADAGWAPAWAVPRPEPGAVLLGFRLVRELGRGSFGRVFLAQQKGLMDRFVAVKVGERLLGETRALASLRHANVVPIHSAHESDGFQLLCMPYLGRTTLADVLERMRQDGGVPPGENAVWSTLHERAEATRPTKDDDPPPADAPDPAGPSLEALRGMPHARAALWVAARLADGLAHAHEHGILHRDVKPANVLIADDGTPVLLDFNLSEDLRLRGALPAVMGGTLPYMSPEHMEAFVGGSRSVDARSDVYSLGLVLYELLTGRHPFPTYEGSMREQVLRMMRDRVRGAPPPARTSPAVRAILRRCLEADPARRYACARQLQDDLQCQLDHLPLRHTPEPSRVERLTKLVRRRPRLAFGGVAAVLLLMLLGVWGMYLRRSGEVARADAVGHLRAMRDERRDAALLLGLPRPDPAERAEGEQLCRTALARYGLPEDDAWERRPGVTMLSEAERGELRGDLGELLLLLARAEWLAGRDSEALRLNGQADEMVRPSERRAVLLQRSFLRKLAGDDGDAARLLALAREISPSSARDYYLLACELCAAGELREAAQAVDEATRRDPTGSAAWAQRGFCHSALGQHAEAVAALTTGVALRPDFWRGYLWRGRAYLELRDFARAEADFDQVLSRRAGFPPALLARALARHGRGDNKGADADLTEAIQHDGGNTRLYFVRSRVRRAAGDAAGAKADFDEGLRREPADELSWLARGRARLPGDPKGALADFEQARKINPRSRDAAQEMAHVLADHLNRQADAEAALGPVVLLYPDYTEARIGRAVVRARLGKRREALDDVAESLRRDTRPLVLYQAGCAYALTSRREPDDKLEAFRLLNRALQGGFGAEHVETDPDLAPLRGDAEYKRLLGLARTKRQKGAG